MLLSDQCFCDRRFWQYTSWYEVSEIYEIHVLKISFQSLNFCRFVVNCNEFWKQLHQKRSVTSTTWPGWLDITALWPQRKRLYCPNECLSKWTAKMRTHKAASYWTVSQKKPLFRQGHQHCCFSAHLNTVQQPPPRMALHVFPSFSICVRWK